MILVSQEELQKAELKNIDGKTYMVFEELQNAKPVNEWIPIKTRPLTEDEKEYYKDLDEDSIEFMYDCSLPDDGQTVLITDRCGNVETDTFFKDDGCYFESNCDADDVLAWMPLPKPYKAESEDNV